MNKSKFLSRKNEIIINWKNALISNKKQRKIIDINNLIIELEKDKSLGKMLIRYFILKNDEINSDNINENLLNNKKLYDELYKGALKRFDDLTIYVKEKNPLIFNIKLYMPKLYEFDISLLLIWIYNVKLDKDKLLIDNNKQFFYLIYNFQEEKNEDLKIDILIKLLKKIQLYIKNSNKNKYE